MTEWSATWATWVDENSQRMCDLGGDLPSWAPFAIGSQVPLFHQQGSGSVLVLATDFEPFGAFWPKMLVLCWNQKMNRDDISGSVISLERKKSTAMESAIEKDRSEKYLQ